MQNRSVPIGINSKIVWKNQLRVFLWLSKEPYLPMWHAHLKHQSNGLIELLFVND